MESAATTTGQFSRFEQLRFASEILRTEGNAVLALAANLPECFSEALDVVCTCRGSVIVTGMGKAGIIGQKVAATLASTGTRSHFLHPAEAVHGDLGRVGSDDSVLAFSFSGETEEVVQLLPHFRAMESPLVAVTGRPNSTLAQRAAVCLWLGEIREACSLGLAPSTSTTTMLALGDALALVASRRRQFGHQDFARYHPGGSLGRKLATVDDVLRPLTECRIARQDETVREVLIRVGRPGRRTGAIMLTDHAGRLRGVFTDSDLARLLERHDETILDTVTSSVMTVAPQSIVTGSRLEDALAQLMHHKISELPVTDCDGKPVGLIDITDLVGLLPPDGLPPSESPTMPDTLPFQSEGHSRE